MKSNIAMIFIVIVLSVCVLYTAHVGNSYQREFSKEKKVEVQKKQDEKVENVEELPEELLFAFVPDVGSLST